MAWKFKRWKIKWNPKVRKFNKKRREREPSREAHLRYKRNKGKMKMALRQSRIKGRVQMKKNKAMGIYKKLAMARRRFKNILKSDMDMDKYLDMTLFEAEFSREINLDANDIEDIEYALREIKRNVTFKDKATEKEFDEFINDALEALKDFDDLEELDDEEEEFLGELISFIEEFAEEADLIKDDDDDYDEDADENSLD